MGGKDETRFVPLIHLFQWRNRRGYQFLANQFRALEEDEIMFLDSIRERQEEEERQREQKDGADVMDFKKCLISPPYLVPSTKYIILQGGRSTGERNKQTSATSIIRRNTRSHHQPRSGKGQNRRCQERHQEVAQGCRGEEEGKDHCAGRRDWKGEAVCGE